MSGHADAILSVLATLALIAGPGTAIYLSRSQKRKNDSDVRKSEADIANEAARINIERERFWQDKLDGVELRCHEEIDGLRRYVNRVVPWVWKAAQKMQIEGIEFESAPQLLPVDDERC